MAVALPVFVSIAENAAATSDPDPSISIVFETVIAPVEAVLIVVMSVAVMVVEELSLIVIVPVCVVTVPVNAATKSATVPARAAVVSLNIIDPEVAALIVLS